ncbi:coronin-1C [Nannizzia gypsea CBS 118893]|uniref:Coronin n=1 Tax=Arthroderma gypseum (strain ATCC MYA-4604 / CBS 118893) TaxID=535722 RepID=E4UN92_ARTGP|nr:coronin-1C [Nannizzia gypsea CBS 118893]EFQ99553.1 coronin-1C [Nannizzia gypsea CBS 118893]
MAGRFVRSSKYRHIFGRSTRKDQCYDSLRVSTNAWDTNLLKVNPEFISVNWETAGGGAFAVIPLHEKGRLPERIPLFRGHTSVVLDTDWNPFNDSLIASGADDGKASDKVPEGFTLHTDAEEIQDVAPVGRLPGHPKKVGHVLFNPAAENVLASSSGDFTIKIWDIEAGASKLTLNINEVIQSMSWSANGSLLVTTSRDKKLRIWDVRQEKPVHEGAGHPGAKNSRAVWMGEHDRIATTGFSRMSDRQMALWDVRAAREPINGFQVLDSISGVCMPFWDQGTQCLYLAGKGDGNIRYFEYQNDKFEYLAEYKSGDPQRGVAFMPKRGVNMHENEVVRAYKTVNDAYIEPISFIVPRRAEVFQDDIYPPTTGISPAMSSSEWFSGKEALPPKIDMARLYEGGVMTELPADATTSTIQAEVKAPEPVKQAEPAPKPAPEPTPAPTAAEIPPRAGMKEQGASMAAAASKYMDKDEDEKETGGSSSFDAPKSQPQEVPSISVSPVQAEASQPAKQEPKESKPTPSAAAPSTSALTSKNADSTASEPLLMKEIEAIKDVLTEQTRTITSQAEELKALKSEVANLKSKLG